MKKLKARLKKWREALRKREQRLQAALKERAAKRKARVEAKKKAKAIAAKLKKEEQETKKDKAAAEKIAQYGIRNAQATTEEAKRVGLPLAIACALLDQESSGGRNVYGHDPVANRAPKGGEVTKQNYLGIYLPDRKAGKGMQGVGPVQLTWYTLQDEADIEGGCWKPRCNMRVGFRHLATNIKTYGEREGLRRYNGSGPAAEAYADSMQKRIREWKKRLK